MQPAFRHLIGATWALIAHEKLASIEPRFSLFHPANPYASVPLADRIQVYAKVGAAMDPSHPENALTVAKHLFPGKFAVG